MQECVSELCSPGTNIFDPNLVKVGANGVQLSVEPSIDPNHFSSSEIYLQEILGYGTYVFQTTGQFSAMDYNTTYGLFTFDHCSTDPATNTTPGNLYNREIDFEVGRWNDVC